MVVNLTFRLEGLEELDAALDALGEELKSEVLTDALRRAAQPLLDRAKQLAPRSDDPLQKRHLADSIKTSRRGGKRARLLLSVSGAASILAGPSAPHGHLVEFGHAIVVGGKASARLTRRDLRAGKKAGTTIGHVPAHPFMRPAWDSTREEVVNSIKRQIGEALERRIKSLARKARTGKFTKKDIGLLFAD